MFGPIPQNVNIQLFGALMILLGCAGCATSGDMAYKYQDNAETCVNLGREIAKQTGDSDYRRSLNQRYYQNCVDR